ncbi:CheY-like chemotaxis protein [Methylorubrum rhodinum]|uniref:CheY-like chemotaxis protein n=1 Tax=Methylorubrum rhodinum TaxID=29428 RepID=A0A840ZGZ3_9HYPH|nr:response regulator [Methylorubrum rhodinum]MBB5756826.1 CheY-like chemotaxis protein [Methylorubrum rhodinum]
MIRSRSLDGRILLIVEDEYFIADDMRRAFEASGATVIGPVGRVEEALEIVASAPRIDGAVLDINLRHVPVYPVADLLRQRGVPFVFATGYESTVIPERLRDAIHCEKPVEAGRVADMLFGEAVAS